VLEIVVTVGIGFVLGFLIGLTGVGGGALVAPALYVILGLGYAGAVSLSVIYSVFTKIVGFVQHLRLANVDWRLTLAYGLPAIPGAIVGSYMLHAAPHLERLFALVMVGILFVVALAMLAEAAIGTLARGARPFDVDQLGPSAIFAVASIGFFVGMLLGVTSVGSGSVVILSMVFLFRIPARRMVGTNIAIGIVMTVPAGLTHAIVGGVDVRRLVLLMAGSIAGTMLGSRGTIWLPDRQLRIAIACILVLSAVATILKAW